MLGLVASYVVAAFPEPSGLIRLLETEAPASTPRVDTQDHHDLDAMSRDQLWKEFYRVGEEAPGLGGPISVMVIGSGVAAFFGYFAISIGNQPQSNNASVVLATAIGLSTAISALVWLIVRVNQGSFREKRLEAIDSRLSRFELSEPWVAPPPPPRPQGVRTLVPAQVQPVVYF